MNPKEFFTLSKTRLLVDTTTSTLITHYRSESLRTFSHFESHRFPLFYTTDDRPVKETGRHIILHSQKWGYTPDINSMTLLDLDVLWKHTIQQKQYIYVQFCGGFRFIFVSKSWILLIIFFFTGKSQCTRGF